MDKKIVIIDNYDSFTYNLVHLVEEIVGHDIDVFRNDKLSLDQLESYEYILISPGPGLPEESGLTLDIIKNYHQSKKIFGVCLGLQSIVVALGGELNNLEKVFHGIETQMFLTSKSSQIFENISSPFMAGRYHSWVAKETVLPNELEVTCRDGQNQIMAIQHKSLPIYAVQFHPESIMTPEGKTMITNFLVN